MYPRSYSEQSAFWDGLYADLEVLAAAAEPLFVDSVTEPTQKDWEDAWVAKGYALPIPAGAEMYWHRDGQLWGLYGVLNGDRYTNLSGIDSFQVPRAINRLGLFVRHAESGLFIGAGNAGYNNDYTHTVADYPPYRYILAEMSLDGSIDVRHSLAPYSYIGRETASPTVHTYLDLYNKVLPVPGSDSVVIPSDHSEFTHGRLANMNVSAGGFIQQISTSILPTNVLARFHAILGNLSNASFNVLVTVSNNPNTQQFQQVFAVPANSVGVVEYTFTPTVSWSGGCIVNIQLAGGSGAGEVFQVGEVGVFFGANQDSNAVVNGHFSATFATNWTQSGTTASTTSTRRQYMKVLRYNYTTNAFTREVIARSTDVTQTVIRAVRDGDTKYLLDYDLVWTRGGNAAANFQALSGGFLGQAANDITEMQAAYIGSRIFSSSGYLSDNNTGGVALVNHHLLYHDAGYVYYVTAPNTGAMAWWELPITRINVATLVETAVDSFYPNAGQDSSNNDPVSSYSFSNQWALMPGNGINQTGSWPVQALDDERLVLASGNESSVYAEDSTGRVWRISQYTDPVDDLREIARFNLAGAQVNGVTIDLASLDNPDEYDHLLLAIEPETQTGASYIHIQFNGDATPGNYDTFFLRLSGATVNNEEILGATRIGVAIPTGVTGSMPHMIFALVMDYKNSSRWKQVLIFGGVTLNVTANNIRNVIGHGVWESTAPITSVRLDDDGTNAMIVAGSVRLIALRGRGRFNQDGAYDSHLA